MSGRGVSLCSPFSRRKTRFKSNTLGQFVAMLAATFMSSVVSNANSQMVFANDSGNINSSTVTGLSMDGRFSSGSGQQSGVPIWAFRLDRLQGTRYDFTRTSENFGASAYGISGDGNWCVGTYQGPPLSNVFQAYRWSEPTGLQFLGNIGRNTNAAARRASHDGSVVAGEAFRIIGGRSVHTAFRWTEAGGMVALPFLPNTDDSYVYGLSADGNVVVGTGFGGLGFGWRWTAETGTVLLPGSSFAPWSQGEGLSADGRYAVGLVAGPNDTALSARWLGTAGPQILPNATGFTGSGATAVSGDGSVVGGGMYGNPADLGRFAYVWTETTGMLKLTDYLTLFGVTAPTNFHFQDVNAISADGLTFAGSGIDSLGRTQGWIAHVPSPGTAVVFGMFALALYRRRRTTV